MSQRDTLQRSNGNSQRIQFHQSFQNTGREGKQDKAESSPYPSYRIMAEADRAYSDSFRITKSIQTQLFSGFKPFRNSISGAKSSHSSQSQVVSKRQQVYKGIKQDFFWPKAERVRSNDTEAVGLGKRSTQEPEIVLNTS
ncbi:hypothetical protein O181_082369 [Austropuccinia psidii MF-1]|uniref:Uncharacterized protein n=1 Tax=Austropuccinia psidii MF-1 TaxID=1389203 RepID=A0A9Q3FP49_9BASI|nr:hypothetical protein [Austropuccinia psidii MF-1]